MAASQQHPPVPPSRTVPLAPWARAHYEGQLDGSRAEALTAQLAGVRLTLRAELAPPSVMLDEADRRILAAMAQPRRLDQIWPLARTPRFRLLSFLYFLRQVGAVIEEGVSAFDSGPHRALDPRRAEACRLLGVDAAADREAIKRAYRRMARALHPDLQPRRGRAAPPRARGPAGRGDRGGRDAARLSGWTSPSARS
jgi:hypothetical protein